MKFVYEYCSPSHSPHYSLHTTLAGPRNQGPFPLSSARIQAQVWGWQPQIQRRRPEQQGTGKKIDTEMSPGFPGSNSADFFYHFE